MKCINKLTNQVFTSSLLSSSGIVFLSFSIGRCIRCLSARNQHMWDAVSGTFLWLGMVDCRSKMSLTFSTSSIIPGKQLGIISGETGEKELGNKPTLERKRSNLAIDQATTLTDWIDWKHLLNKMQTCIRR